MTHSERHMRAAAEHIVAVDPAFAPIVESSPLCFLARPGNQPATHFAALVRSVIAQQLSTKVADTLTDRLTTALEGDVSPAKVLALDEELMRGAGLSGAKTRTIKGLAAALHSGDLDIEAALASPDEHRLRSELTALWGIGRWTAEMFEMFTLHRLDVWPVGDLAMRRGWARLHGLSDDPGAKHLDPLGEPLRPYRSVAAWYCWREVDGDNPSW
jgi:DNA-3-methyladenine glycosylase II